MNGEKGQKRSSRCSGWKRWGVVFLMVIMLLAAGCSQKDPTGETKENIGTTILAGGDREKESQTAADIREDDHPGSSADGDEDSTPEITLGIDVSKWQGKIDWQQVADAGIDFAIVRVGFRTTDTGEIKEDPYAEYNLQQASKAGVRLGAYFFSTAVTEEEAREEAQFTIQMIAGYPITYPVVYNCEGFLSKSSRMYGVSTGQRTDHALVFLAEVELAGYEAMFHASKADLTDGVSWDTARIEAEYPVWVAQYPEVPYPQTSRSTYYGEHTMWQYTSQGTVPGIDAYVDVNVAYFAYDEIAMPKDTTGASDSGSEDVLIDASFREADELVTAKVETNLRNAPGTEGTQVIATIRNGEWVERTGIGSNGWSRLNYQGQTVYALTSYLTTDENYDPEDVEDRDIVWTEVSDTMTAKEVTNLRDKPTTDGSQVIASIRHGEVVKRIAIGSNGWSRVIYNGQTLYAVTSFLTEVE